MMSRFWENWSVMSTTWVVIILNHINRWKRGELGSTKSNIRLVLTKGNFFTLHASIFFSVLKTTVFLDASLDKIKSDSEVPDAFVSKHFLNCLVFLGKHFISLKQSMTMSNVSCSTKSLASNLRDVHVNSVEAVSAIAMLCYWQLPSPGDSSLTKFPNFTFFSFPLF